MFRNVESADKICSCAPGVNEKREEITKFMSSIPTTTVRLRTRKLGSPEYLPFVWKLVAKAEETQQRSAASNGVEFSLQ
jgi:hypothetical protein